MKKTRLFTEDDALKHDETYPGIRGWWKTEFPGRDFNKDWDAAHSQEEDYGDSFKRPMEIEGRKLEVTFSFDGYRVDEVK